MTMDQYFVHGLEHLVPDVIFDKQQDSVPAINFEKIRVYLLFGRQNTGGIKAPPQQLFFQAQCLGNNCVVL